MAQTGSVSSAAKTSNGCCVMSLLGRAIRSRRWRRRHVPIVPAPPGQPITPIETLTTMVTKRNAGVGARFSFVLTGTTNSPVWGNLIYTDDSHLDSAAVHAGVLAAGQTSVVVVELVGPPEGSYASTRRNGVSSRYWPNTWPWAYKFVAGASAPAQEQYILDAFAANDTTFVQPITRVDEGSAFYFVLRTTNVAAGNVGYRLSGFQTGDVKDALGNNIALSGNLTVAYTANNDSVNGRATLYVQIPANTSFGDNNSVSLVLNNGRATKTVTVRDTTPTYRLTRSAGSVNEGQTITITLLTTNLAAGTNVPYTITSPQGLDIFRGVPYSLSTPHPMTGNFVVDANGVATQTFEIKNDSLTEGTETFTLKLNNDLATISVAIYDTSRAPPPPPRPPIRPAITATMQLICERGSTAALAATRPSGNVWGPSPVAAYSYSTYGRILAVDINIKNAPLFTSFAPVLAYSSNSINWYNIPTRWRRAYTSLYIYWWYRWSWALRNRRWPVIVYKNAYASPIGNNTSASANYRLIDVGHWGWSPNALTYLTSSPPYNQEKFSFWPFYPQDNRLGIVNTPQYLKITLPAQANSLEFIFRMY